MKVPGLPALLALGCAVWLAAIGSASPVRELNLPEEVRSYKSWARLLKSPSPVPFDFWIRCMAPSAADRSAARQKYGPHTERYIQVYANEAAAAAVSRGKTERFPAGAVLVKEKLLGSPEGAADGVAVMLKRPRGAFAETNGWEFLYFPASGEKRLTHDGCASCHASASRTDYVFRKYPG